MKLTKKIVIPCLAFIGAAAIATAVFINKHTSSSAAPDAVNLNDYFCAVEEGVDGYGMITQCKLDSDAFAKKYADNAKITKTGNDEYRFCVENEYGELDTILIISGVKTYTEAVKNFVEGHFPRPDLKNPEGYSQTKGKLSNGDKFDITWKYDDKTIKDIEKVFNIKIKFSDFEYSVKNLQKLTKVDPFKNTVLGYVGENGEGTLLDTGFTVLYADNIKTKYNEEISEKLIVELPENNGKLSNGDTVHVYIENPEYQRENLAKSYHISYSRTEADIKLRGFNAYGQSKASNGKKVTVNLNDYITFSYTMKPYGDYYYLKATINYEKILFENLDSLSLNVAEEDLYHCRNSCSAARAILKELPPLEVAHNDLGNSNPKNGDVLNYKWKLNEENLKKLKKVMNIEFKYSDFTKTVTESKE